MLGENLVVRLTKTTKAAGFTIKDCGEGKVSAVYCTEYGAFGVVHNIPKDSGNVFPCWKYITDVDVPEPAPVVVDQITD